MRGRAFWASRRVSTALAGLVAAALLAGAASGAAARSYSGATPTSSGAVNVSAGIGHACAIVASRAVYCWGINLYGELGGGTTATSWDAVRVQSIGGAVAVSAAGFYSCAVVSSGGVKCWGYNGSGQLGDGTSSSIHSDAGDGYRRRRLGEYERSRHRSHLRPAEGRLYRVLGRQRVGRAGRRNDHYEPRAGSGERHRQRRPGQRRSLRHLRPDRRGIDRVLGSQLPRRDRQRRHPAKLESVGGDRDRERGLRQHQWLSRLRRAHRR